MTVVPGRPLPIPPGADLHGLRVTVMGLGLFSGGVETVRYFVSKGADVTVTDLKAEGDLPESVAEIRALPVRLHLGGHRPEDFEGPDLVVVSPAVPPESEWLRRAVDHGARLVTELGITMGLLPCPAVWVTGTCGKSTTTALLGEMLVRGGVTAHVGGNIGRALVARAEHYRPTDRAVLEVSSFQLEWMARDGIVPDLAVVTNVTPNHLDRHATFDRYLAAKMAAIAGQGPAILNRDDPASSTRLAARAGGRVHFVSLEREVPRGAFLAGDEAILRDERHEERLFRVPDLRLPGSFNRANALMAALAARLSGGRREGVAAAAADFRGLPHRLEDLGVVRGVRGVRAINDSKATTPEAAIRALRALSGGIVLVAGGFERGADLAEFAAEVRARARAAVLLGASAERLAGEIGEGGPPVVRVGGVEEAVARGLALAGAGDTLLLSPGHASWDMFRNYEERGDRFRAAFQSAAGA